MRSLLLVCTLATLVPQSVVAQGTAPARLAAVRDTIEAIMASRNAASFAVAVARDGEILWEEGFGFADRERRVRATPQRHCWVTRASRTTS